MATIPKLCMQRLLEKFDGNLGWRQLAKREFYGFPNVVKWIEEELPKHIPELSDGRQSLFEQLDFALNEFIRGADMDHYQKCHIMTPHKAAVYELKTPDLRIFGWVWKKDIFIAADIDTAMRIKTHNLYRGYLGQAVRKRDALDLDPPKFISGSVADVFPA